MAEATRGMRANFPAHGVALDVLVQLVAVVRDPLDHPADVRPLAGAGELSVYLVLRSQGFKIGRH